MSAGEETIERFFTALKLGLRTSRRTPSSGDTESAVRLVGLIACAVASGEFDDIHWLAHQHATHRSRRAWLRMCMNAVALTAFLRAELLVDEGETLPVLLADIDARALELDADRVREVLSRFRRPGGCRTVAGVAARLAVDCGAFGYSDIRTARSAFSNLASAVSKEKRGCKALYTCPTRRSPRTT